MPPKKRPVRTSLGLGQGQPARRAHSHSPLSRLYAQACQLKTSGVQPNATILANLENHVLLIQPKEFTPNESTALCRFLQHKKTSELLEVLVLTQGELKKSKSSRSTVTTNDERVQIQEKIWQCLLNTLRKSRSLRSVIVHQYESLDLAAVRDLVGSLENSAHLTSLCFRNIPLGDVGFAQIVGILSSMRIKTLMVQGCGLTDLSCGKIVSLLKSHDSYRDVYFWNTTLREYPLSNYERQISNKHGAQLSAVQGLLALDLSGNHITDIGAEILAAHLKREQWILGVNLARNEIGSNGLRLLADIVKNPNLIFLGIVDNPGRLLLDCQAQRDVINDIEMATGRSLGGPLDIQSFIPEEVEQVLLHWKATDGGLKSNKTNHTTNRANRQSTTPSILQAVNGLPSARWDTSPSSNPGSDAKLSVIDDFTEGNFSNPQTFKHASSTSVSGIFNTLSLIDMHTQDSWEPTSLSVPGKRSSTASDQPSRAQHTLDEAIASLEDGLSVRSPHAQQSCYLTKRPGSAAVSGKKSLFNDEMKDRLKYSVTAHKLGMGDDDCTIKLVTEPEDIETKTDEPRSRKVQSQVVGFEQERAMNTSTHLLAQDDPGETGHRPPSRISVRPRSGFFDPHAGGHTALLAPDESAFRSPPEETDVNDSRVSEELHQPMANNARHVFTPQDPKFLQHCQGPQARKGAGSSVDLPERLLTNGLSQVYDEQPECEQGLQQTSVNHLSEALFNLSAKFDKLNSRVTALLKTTVSSNGLAHEDLTDKASAVNGTGVEVAPTGVSHRWQEDYGDIHMHRSMEDDSDEEDEILLHQIRNKLHASIHRRMRDMLEVNDDIGR